MLVHRLIIAALMLLPCIPAQAQQEAASFKASPKDRNVRDAPGVETFGKSKPAGQPTSLLLDVNGKDANVRFSTPEDFRESKVVKNCYHIKVEAPDVPWTVTASTAFEQLGLDFESASKLSQLVQLRVNNGIPIRLSDRPQQIINYNPNNPSKNFSVDLIIDPPFDVDANSLNGVINFQLQLL